MKFLHTADWHIGRKLNGFSLLEEQQHAFSQIMDIAEKEEVEAIVIAGDLYDRSVPSVEAVALFNEMMVEMNLNKKYPVLAISGNHDSSTRLETGNHWLKAQQFHLHTRLEQAFEPVEMGDSQFYLLPYFEPFHARKYFEDDSLRDIQSSMTAVLAQMKESFEPNKQQILVSHFFAAGSSRSESETTLEVGGLDSVPVEMLLDFDYVALGHLHYKDAIKKELKVQYSGALLKYSLSEAAQEKGVRVVEVTGEGVSNTFIPIKPLRDVRPLVGAFKDLVDKDFYDQQNREDYVAIALTDETVIENSLHELRQVYPRMISLERVKKETTGDNEGQSSEEILKLKPEDLVAQYFKENTENELTKQQKKWLEEAVIEINQEK